MNVSLLSGFVVEDNASIQLRSVPDNQDKVTSFTIAVPKDNPAKNAKETAYYINIVAWDKAAEFAVEELDKGMYVEVEGYIYTGRRNIRGIEKVIYKNGEEVDNLSLPVFEINTRWSRVVSPKRAGQGSAMA